LNKLLAILSTLLICTFVNAQNTSKFPSYEQVVTQFMSRIKVCKIENTWKHKIAFEKKSDGYWVGISIYSVETKDFSMKHNTQFWSPEKGFQAISLDAGASSTPNMSMNLLKQAPNPIPNQDKFNIHPYYGYINWEDDVIQYYTEKEKTAALSAKEYYSLGRAYSSKCGTYIIKEGKKIKTSTKEANALIINTYTEWQDKALLNFEKCYKKDPNLETVVGRIYNKYCHELMLMYHNLVLFSNKELALKAIEGKELYSETTRVFAKNLLNNCPKNAILFCYGDNDTWALMYQQLVKNYRTDILLVNTSLLNTDAYIDLIQNASIYENSIDLGISREVYAGDNSKALFLERKSENEAIEVANMIKTLEQFIKESDPNAGGYPTLTTSKITLSGPGDKTIELKTEGGYLIKGDLISLLILEQNKGKRAICYTPTFAFGENSHVTRTGIYKRLHQTGYGHQFKYELTTNNPRTNVDAVENYKALKENMTWTKIEKIYSEDVSNFNAFKFTMLLSINKLMERNEKEKALDLVNDFIATFNQDIVTLSPNDVTQFADIYFKLDKRKQAKAILQNYFEALVSKTRLTKEESQSVRYINRMMDKYNIITFDKELEMLLNKPVK
jgi:hypothetical protein